MRGEALRTGGLLTRDFPSELVEIDVESVHLLAGERHQEIRPVEAGDRRSSLLRDQPLGIPADRRRQPNIFLYLGRRATEGFVYLVGKLDGQGRHGFAPGRLQRV